MGQTSTTSAPTRKRPPPAPPRQRQPAHDEADFLASIGRIAESRAERAVLELDALDVAPRRYTRVRRGLIKRRDRMLDEWRAAAVDMTPALRGDTVERENHLALVFRDRVRELRAASGPRGHA